MGGNNLSLSTRASHSFAVTAQKFPCQHQRMQSRPIRWWIETLWKIQEESSQFLLTFLLQQELVSQQKWQRSVSSRVGWHLGFHPVKPEGLRRAEVVLCAGDINILKIPAGTAIIKMAMFLPKPTVFSPKQCEKPQNICLPFQLGRQQVWSRKYSLDHTLPDLLRLPVFLFATSWICTN